MFLVLRLLGHLPLPLLLALGWCLGWLHWLASAQTRQRLRTHTARARLSRAQRCAAIGAAGQQVAELARVWFGPPVPTAWDGDEYIERALQQGLGLLFLTPHLGCFELTAQAYAARFAVPAAVGGSAGTSQPQALRQPITVLYRPPRSAWLATVLAAARQRPGLHTAAASLSGVRQLLQALKRGQAVGLLPDQVPPAGQGVWAPFFGQPAFTMTLAARLAQVQRVQVLLAWGERLRGGRGYVVHVRPWGALMPEPLSTQPELAAAQINQAMERVIAHCPQQYAWGYARYKPPLGSAAAAQAPTAVAGPGAASGAGSGAGKGCA